MASPGKPSSKLSLEELPRDGHYTPESEHENDRDAHDMSLMGKRQVLRVSLARQ